MKIRHLFLFLALAFLLGPCVYLLIRQAPSTKELSTRPIVTMHTLQVDEGQSLQLQAPTPDTAILIRVDSEEPVQIRGHLSADHPVFIMAKGGVEIWPDAQIQLPPAPESEGAKCQLPNE